MSPRRLQPDESQRVAAEIRRYGLTFGMSVRDARLARGWTVKELAARAAIAPDTLYATEAGEAPSASTSARIAVALGRRLSVELVDPRRREQRPNLSVDPVHSAMGEFEAAHFRQLGARFGLDEPFQHYQFAGRADFVVWDTAAAALLHIENRTRFPDFQDMAGSFNNKRAYFAGAFAERAGVRHWQSQTHVIAALWSSEVLHALRLRTASFRGLCPDPVLPFEAWWNGEAPTTGGSCFVVLDPLGVGRRHPWSDLDDALTARPRYRGYADAATRVATPRV